MTVAMRREDSVIGAGCATGTAQLRILDGAKLRLWRDGATLRLTIENERTVLKVAILRAFPITRPEEWFSIRDGAGDEVGVLRSLDDLDSESRKAAQEELERRYLIPTISRVINVRERFGVVEWDVETDRGRRSFMTRDLREHVIRPSAARFIITDIDENRYQITDLYALDRRSQALVMTHL